MTRVDHHDTDVVGGDGGVVRALPHDERVERERLCFLERFGRRARARADAPTPRSMSCRHGSAAHGPTVPPYKGVDPPGQVSRFDVALTAHADVDSLEASEPTARLQAQLLRQQDVVP